MEKQAAAGLEAQGARPRFYTDEYRRQVVDMVASTGRTAMSVASELGIHHTLISRWIRRYGRLGSASAAAPARPAAATLLKPVPVLHAEVKFADASVQIHGGNGYALEYKISRVLCAARILNTFEGAAET